MLKRIGLFLLTNLLVILAISIIMNIVLPMLGISPKGLMGLAVFCSVVGMTGAFISLAISRWIAKKSYDIRLIDAQERDPGLRSIYDMVAQLSKKAGLPAVPEIGVYEAAELNAFATGPSKNKSLVAFSSGLLNAMGRDEVEAVAAHEISHIANGDMVTMTLLTGIANALVMFLARIVTYAIDSFLRSDDDSGGLGFFAHMIIVFILETVFMLFASLALAAFSRRREYRADAGSARLYSANAMISALQSLNKAIEIPTPKDSLAMAKISSSRGFALWATHPSIEDRIAALKEL